MSRDCRVAVPYNVTGLSAVCDLGISCSYSLFFRKYASSDLASILWPKFIVTGSLPLSAINLETRISEPHQQINHVTNSQWSYRFLCHCVNICASEAFVCKQIIFCGYKSGFLIFLIHFRVSIN